MPSTTAVAPLLRTQKRSPARPAANRTASGGAVEDGVAGDRLRGVEGSRGGRPDGDLAAGHPLADVVVGLTFEIEAHAVDDERAEALAGAPGQPDRNCAFRQTPRMLDGDRVGDLGADGAVLGADGHVDDDRLAAGDGVTRQLDHGVVERRGLRARGRRACGAEIPAPAAAKNGETSSMPARPASSLRREQIGAADELVERASAERGQLLADRSRQMQEIGDDLIRGAGELGAQVFTLGGDTGRAGVEVALPGHVAADGDQHRGAEPELLGAENRRHDDVFRGLEPAVGAQPHARAEAVLDQRLLRFGETELPGAAGVLDRRQRRGAGASGVAADQDVVGARLGDAGGDGADPGFGDQLDADLGARVDLTQVVDELGQVLDRVDVVMRRRRDQGQTRARRGERWR